MQLTIPSDSREGKIGSGPCSLISTSQYVGHDIGWEYPTVLTRGFRPMSCDLHHHLAFETVPPAASCLTCKPFQIGPKATSWTNGCPIHQIVDVIWIYILQGSLYTTVSSVHLDHQVAQHFRYPKSHFLANASLRHSMFLLFSEWRMLPGQIKG